jgi:hypothetical protein
VGALLKFFCNLTPSLGAEIMPAWETGVFIFNFCIVISHPTITTLGESGLDIVKNSDYY